MKPETLAQQMSKLGVLNALARDVKIHQITSLANISSVNSTVSKFPTVTQINDFSKGVSTFKDLNNLWNMYDQHQNLINDFISDTDRLIFSQEYKNISSNPTPEGEKYFIMYKSFCIIICVLLTFLEFSAIPFVKNLADALIQKYGDDENMKGYVDTTAKLLIDFIHNNIKKYIK